jgi:hypothetical protein
MYYCNPGKRLVELYNINNNVNHTVESFFYEIYVPLMFDGKSLLNIQNSPFNNPSFSKLSIQI